MGPAAAERRTQAPIFVLSSGRAGSTLLARLLQRHPRLLCVSDLFEPVGEEPYFDRETVVDGPRFFDILSRPSLPQRIAYWREQPTGELLYLPEKDEDVSLLLSYTLPFLAGGDPMPLYREVEAAVCGFDEAPMADQLVRFFDWLRDRFGAELWVERTGGSLPHTRRIVETWPDARIVHNYRDPRETAISMMTGSFFRLYLELTKNPELGRWDWSVEPPLEEMGAMLDRWMVEALAVLETVPAERQVDLSYEELVGETEAVLLRLVGFLFDRAEPTDEDRGWARDQVAEIQPAPLRFPDLPSDEKAALERACAASLEALGYA